MEESNINENKLKIEEDKDSISCSPGKECPCHKECICSSISCPLGKECPYLKEDRCSFNHKDYIPSEKDKKKEEEDKKNPIYSMCIFSNENE
jgi:hypothetical protein